MRARATRRLRRGVCPSIFRVASAAVAIGHVALGLADAQAQPPARSRIVEVTVRGEERDASPLVETIRELLGRHQLTVVTSGEPEAALARVRVELPAAGGSGSAAVEVVSGPRGRVVLRRAIPIESGSAIGREAIAHVVQEAVEAELLGAETPPPAPSASAPPDGGAPPGAVETPRVPPPPADRPREGERSARSALVLDITTFGGVGPVAAGSGPVPRVGAGAAVGVASRFRPSIGLLFAGAFAFDRDSELVTASTSILSARMLPGLELARSEHFTLDVALGGGVDVITVDPRSESLPRSAVAGASTRWSPVGTAMIGTRIDVVPRVVFLVAATVDVDPIRRSYVVARGGAAESLVGPWAVRPALVLGFAFTALGPPTFASAGATEPRTP